MIETERLILRPFLENDAEELLEYLEEPLVNCFACMKLNTLEEAKEEVKRRVKDTEYCFAIVLKETGKVIGEIEAHPESHAPDEEHTVLDTFSPCWMLNKEYHGQGYAYEAARAFFDYLFHEKGARRIYAYTEDYNVPSQKLCEKLGMRREGTFMEFVSFVNDENGAPIYENTMQYAILKKEWLARKKEQVVIERKDNTDFELVPITEADLPQYKKDMQEAFQKGFEEEFGESEMHILPEQDIDNSLQSKGAVAYKAVVDGAMVGGAIVVIDEATQHNHLDFLYVKYGTQSKGIGKLMWDSVERLHPETKVWETCTPYFEKRNLHFYVNKCGFHVVAFWNKGNPDPHKPEDYTGDDFEGMFAFQKVMQR